MRTVAEIDRDINAGRREFRRTKNPTPEQLSQHHERERVLFRERGVAQLERDEKAARAAARMHRAAKLKKCPTCGARTLAA